MGKFTIKKGNTGFSFNLVAGNGEIIGTSEVYKALASAKKGIASIQKNAPVANLEDQTVTDFKKEVNPKFEIFTDKGGKFRFRLKAKNGEIILASQAYKDRSGCTGGIASVRKNAPKAKLVMVEDKE